MAACACAAQAPGPGGDALRLPASSAAVRDSDCIGYGEPERSPYVLPFPAGRAYRLTQGNCSAGSHGPHTPYRFAFDFAMPIGDTVVAARAGRVIVVEEAFEDGNRAAGQENEVVVQHEDGTVARYVHLTRGGALVREGDHVRQRQPLARSGDTGMSRGPHLHFDVAVCEHHHCATLAVTFRNAAGAPRRLVAGQTYVAGPTADRGSR